MYYTSSTFDIDDTPQRIFPISHGQTSRAEEGVNIIRIAVSWDDAAGGVGDVWSDA
ncbi:hypothetical protein PC119_g737 [Phytophthora cactorum]|nr:hypothetical protein PC114_g14369 [Phytophthora cactorum]KAG2977269.1 hypothetical protein PC120_g25539 [Phytophthora cactorum]KAG3041354.1 hypothetical protein PC119_g737 [Phytophthora cactorum]KAG3156172.1 hypothetical protein C6341_g15159 [Phytophthora cactorum]KAG3204985.1 hypothetical protein PC128_g1669 [Phytophthora cactorum]